MNNDLTYSTYLNLSELLSLQCPLSDPPEHNETLFIIVHQVYELWFKLLLHEFERIRVDLTEGALYDVSASFKRTRTIMKVMVEQVDIIETLTPLSFNSFRARLENSSGFQSVQFRELEFMLGYKRADMLAYHSPGSQEHLQLLRRLHERSVIDCFYDFLEKSGVSIPAELRERAVTLPSAANEEVQEGILDLYKDRHDMRNLFELMTDFDEGFQEWRYRHIKLVERTIGSKQGTGGSLGVEFLKTSLFHPLFADLWAIRHKM
jgi:tryptophan 2,3-dioxygenase